MSSACDYDQIQIISDLQITFMNNSDIFVDQNNFSLLSRCKVSLFSHLHICEKTFKAKRFSSTYISNLPNQIYLEVK